MGGEAGGDGGDGGDGCGEGGGGGDACGDVGGEGGVDLQVHWLDEEHEPVLATPKTKRLP